MFKFNSIGLCPDWPEFNPKNSVANARQAMDAAEKWMDVPQVRLENKSHLFKACHSVPLIV